MMDVAGKLAKMSDPRVVRTYMPLQQLDRLKMLLEQH